MARRPASLALLFAALPLATVRAAEDPSVFFESRIRPLLIENCQECHGERKQKGNLRWDSREGWQRGGDSGPPLVPGNPDASLLIKAISYADRDLKMPPKKKLSAGQIADLRKWVELGAPDPRAVPASTSSTSHRAPTVAEGRDFWSFKPLQSHSPPAVANEAWVRNEIDRFILAKLERLRLAPSPDSAPAVLVRRLCFDLCGLPLSASQVARFIETTPHASSLEVDQLIDALLATPQFAERWTSHWLDIVRFAESSGGGRTLPFKDAWRYRDYVIDSFRDDVPLTRFLTEQIAGDLLPHADAAERRRQLTATGFLALGPTNYEEQDKQMLRMDIVDEQLDTIGRSFLGMTIGCARCHDHKFDPIPTRDYYALAGIFRSTRTLKNYTDNVAHWIDAPLPLDGEAEARAAHAEKQVASLKNDIAAVKDQLRSTGSDLRPKGSQPVTVSDLPGIVVDDEEAMKVGEWKTSLRIKPYVGSGYSHDADCDKGAKTISFTPRIPKTGRYEVRVAFNAGPTRADKIAVTIFHADGEDLVHISEQTESLEGLAFASLGTFRFEDSGQGYVLVSNAGSQGYVTVDAVQFLPEMDASDPAFTAGRPKSSSKVAALKSRLSSLEAQLKEIEKTSPRRPEAMSVADDEKPEDCPIHIRGNIRNLGATVPRGFLEVTMRSKSPSIPADQSGRLQFARWLVSESNPLTARVYVNRIWHWLFGAGLVRTTENFGTTGEAPSHPELLDYLARRFIEEGWSTRKLVKLIVSSRTYQQTSQVSNSGPQVTADPDNRLLWRMNRKRLDAECIRDAMLSISGTLDARIGGPNMAAGVADSNSTATQNLEYNFQFTDTRRSLYTPAFRNVRHPLFEVFDFADINQPIHQRVTSTVAPQALFMMNHPFVIGQARAAATRLLKQHEHQDDPARIRLAWHMSLGRAPTNQELVASLDFVEATTSGNSTEDERRDVWARFIQALWSTPEFRFVP